MTNSLENSVSTEQIKQKLGETTEKLETKAGKLWTSYSPHYSNLEPWQRGVLLITLTLCLLFVVYYLTKSEKSQPRELTDSERKRLEALAEERILKRAEFLKKLRE